MSTALPESLAEKIISEKIQEWEARREQRKEEEKPTGIYPFLTISRDFGCGEETIVPMLEKELGWKVYGRNLLDVLAEQETLSRKFIETLDEQRQNMMDDWVRFLIHSGAVLQKDYVLKISRMIQVVASHESAIFLGRGAGVILRNRPEGLNVKFTAPFEKRVENIMALRNLARKDAESLVRKNDADRTEFLLHYFGADDRNSGEYDLVFNTNRVNSETLLQMIIQLLKNPVPR